MTSYIDIFVICDVFRFPKFLCFMLMFFSYSESYINFLNPFFCNGYPYTVLLKSKFLKFRTVFCQTGQSKTFSLQLLHFFLTVIFLLFFNNPWLSLFASLFNFVRLHLRVILKVLDFLFFQNFVSVSQDFVF